MFQKILNLHIYFCQKFKNSVDVQKKFKNSVDGKKLICYNSSNKNYFRSFPILFKLFHKGHIFAFSHNSTWVKRQWNLTDKSIDRHLLQSCIKARKECFLRYFSQMMFLPLNWTSTFIVQTWHDVLVFFFQCIFNA